MGQKQQKRTNGTTVIPETIAKHKIIQKLKSQKTIKEQNARTLNRAPTKQHKQNNMNHNKQTTQETKTKNCPKTKNKT